MTGIGKQRLVVLLGVVCLAWLQSGCRRAEPEIIGRVVLQGTPLPEININLDPTSARLRPNGLTTRHYLVSSNGGLANAFVYIKAGLSNWTAGLPATPAIMEYRGMQFEPYVIGVRVNQPVRLRNADPVLHNAHCTPRTPGSREWNIGMPPQGAPPKLRWDKALYRRLLAMVGVKSAPSGGNVFSFALPEPFVRLKCDVHPWEFGYVCVIDHPFFAVTGTNGQFRFPPGLPPGKYVIEARHLKAGSETQEVVIGPRERKQLKFTLHVPTNGPQPAAGLQTKDLPKP